MRWHDQGLMGLTFDDVLIRPAHSDLTSRSDVNFHQSLWHDDWESCPAPIMVANMATIATVAMRKALAESGVIVPFHRFQSIQMACAEITETHLQGSLPNAASVGLHDPERALKLIEAGADMLFLELAHADSKDAIQEVKRLKRDFPTICLVVGNVATADATKRLKDAGADFVKIGIGPGSVCTTRLITGCGVPQLSAIAECAPHAQIIADGGVRTSGDIVKALAAGAKYIMIGSLFAGTDESKGLTLDADGRIMYYGMASEEAGRVTEGNVPEGIAVSVPYIGSAQAVAKKLLAGVRQGMAMVGAHNLEELREKAVFQLVSPATIIENRPHIRER